MPYADQDKRKANRKSHIKWLTAPTVMGAWQLLKDGKMRTAHEIAEELHFSVPAINEALTSLEFHNEAHLHDYKMLPIGGYAALWIIGPGERAKKPPKQTPEERTAKKLKWREDYEQRRIADKESAYQEAQRAIRDAFKPKRDALTAAFFGDA